MLTLSFKNCTFDIVLIQADSMASMQFEQALLRYVSIVVPIGRSIKSLEATDTTAGDVFVFWSAIASYLRDLFSRPEAHTGIPPELAEKITAIINKRYAEIIDESPTDIYFVSFFLNPRT